LVVRAHTCTTTLRRALARARGPLRVSRTRSGSTWENRPKAPSTWALFCGRAGRRADAEGVAEGVVDLGRVIGGTIVEQQGERRLSRGEDAVVECLDDGGGVLLAADAGAGEGARVRVDIQLEVEVETPAVDDDGHLHAVADPLGAREEGAERAAQCAFVGSPALAVNRATQAVDMEDARDRFTPEGHEQAIAHGVTEADEGAVPARPGVEHGLHLRSRRREAAGPPTRPTRRSQSDRAASP